MVEFRLLGAVEVWAEGRPVSLGHARQRSVLAALLIDADQWVSPDQLLHRVWGDELPRRARETLYTYLSRLRGALEGHGPRITRRSGGYVLSPGDAEVDLHRFRELAERARATADPGAALAQWREALGLWRGEALSGLASPWLDGVRQVLDDERWAAFLDHNDAALAAGRHAESLPRLAGAVAERELDQRLAGQLMLALYRSGRAADALTHYERVRRRLAEELGTDPGPGLRDLYQRVLADAPGLQGGAPSAAAAVPRQLPTPPPVFVGRHRERDELGTGTAHGRPVVLHTVGGAGGVGKTWLALRWAHDNLARFPDGQLYADLRGFDPAAEPAEPHAVLRRFLEALGVDPDGMPGDADARTALYRSLVAGKRLLVLLDNARDADQVRPLLPGGQGCVAVITSRNRMDALVATHGARPVPLGMLPPDAARELLARHLGARRVDDEAQAVDALVEHCAGLPLALGIVAARAIAHPEFPLAVLAGELRPADERLDALETGDLSTSLRTVLRASWRPLSAPARDLLAALGSAPATPDISRAALAALAGRAAGPVRRVVAELEAAHLLQQHRPGRFRVHDLVRLYAAETAREAPGAAEAPRRLIDFYVQTAHVAWGVIDGGDAPFADRLAPPAPLPGCEPLRLSGVEAVMEWFGTEHDCLLAAQEAALDQGLPEHVVALAWSLLPFHWARHHLAEYLAAWRSAATAVERFPVRPVLRIVVDWRLGHASAVAGRYEEALAHLARARAAAEEAGDAAGLAHVHRTTGWVLDQQGDLDAALGHARQALGLYREVGHAVWLAMQQNAVGWLYTLLGRYEEAREQCEQALGVLDRDSHEAERATILDTLGLVAHRTGRLPDAVAHYRRSLDLVRGLGLAREEAETLDRLAETYRDLGRPEAAREAWEQALAIHLAQGRAGAAAETRRHLAEGGAAADVDA
ncbi:hypothetical protein CAG99_19840 [Streptomyces marincola]|uniref:OmpR/PhoB-type domain-containing protein n=1 Tax=Streptomyces marincola TaxID=2878388 RepID=A0A1W7D115_9ACTN|nr:hypothetical protein CAG99_19840 [Streptomyces marincola]